MPKTIRYTPAFLILCALSLDLLGGRWAAYIKSPVSGVYLPDFLFLCGVAITAFNLSTIRRFFKSKYAASVCLAISFVALKLYWGVVVQGEGIKFSLRDGAALFFLTTVPFVGYALGYVSKEFTLTVVRWASTSYLTLFFAVCVGILDPFESNFLGTADARVLEYGGDLIGVIIGVAYISWSSCFVPKKSADILRIIFLSMIFLHNSRGGLLATLVLVSLSLLTFNKSVWKKELIIILAGVALGFAAQTAVAIQTYYGAPFYSPHINVENMKVSADASKEEMIQGNLALRKIQSFSSFYSIIKEKIEYKDVRPKEDNQYFIPEFTSPSLQRFIESTGTIGGRVATWIIITEYMLREGFWMFGGSYGSDILHVSCSNPNLPTYNTTWPGGGIIGPKCPIDSNETSLPVRDTHNIFLTIFTYNGLVGLILCFYMLYKYISRENIVGSLHNTAFLFFIIGYATSGMFSTFASYPFVLVPCAIFLGAIQSRGSSD